jgi:hypothetical protein
MNILKIHITVILLFILTYTYGQDAIDVKTLVKWIKMKDRNEVFSEFEANGLKFKNDDQNTGGRDYVFASILNDKEKTVFVIVSDYDDVGELDLIHIQTFKKFRQLHDRLVSEIKKTCVLVEAKENVILRTEDGIPATVYTYKHPSGVYFDFYISLSKEVGLVVGDLYVRIFRKTGQDED